MTAPITPMSEQQLAARKHVRRTALVVALIAIAIYVGFILSAVLSR